MSATSIHGHDVMRMMLEAGSPFTRESLEAAIGQRFGADARFHTCAVENLTAGELIAFLDGRGKFMEVGDGLQTEASRICDHDHDHGDHDHQDSSAA